MFICFVFQVYALTRERDTLRREQSKKSDAAALLKEKDEIISQVMAEGIPFKSQKITYQVNFKNFSILLFPKELFLWF